MTCELFPLKRVTLTVSLKSCLTGSGENRVYLVAGKDRRNGDIVYGDVGTVSPVGHNPPPALDPGQAVRQESLRPPALPRHLPINAKYLGGPDKGLKGIADTGGIKGTVADTERTMLGGVGETRQALAFLSLLHCPMKPR